MNNTFKLLEQDHDQVKKVIEELLNTTPKTQVKRKNLLEMLKDEVQNHEKIEEMLVYPTLKEKKLTHDLTLEAYEEHHVINGLLKELCALKIDDESWIAKLAILQKNLLHHIKEEETDLFIKAKTALTQEELDIVKKGIAKSKHKAI